MAVDIIARAMASGGGGQGSSDYSDLSNKPKINGVELSGNKSTADLNIQSNIPIITLALSQIISQTPITIQVTTEQQSILEESNNTTIIVNMPSGLFEFDKCVVVRNSESASENLMCFAADAYSFSAVDHTIIETGLYGLVYDTVTKQLVLSIKMNESGGSQSDWNQNDNTANDYIKNRTHWIEELEPQQVSINNSDADDTSSDVTETGINYSEYNFYTQPIDNLFNYFKYLYDNNMSMTITIGNETFDEVSIYKIDENDYQAGDDYDTFYNGEGAAGFYFYADNDNNYGYGQYETITGNSVQFEMAGLVYHTLDKNFIPEEIATKEYVDSAIAAAITDALGGDY